MAVKVVYAYSETAEFDADRVVPDPECPELLALFKGDKIIGYIPKVGIMSAVIVSE